MKKSLHEPSQLHNRLSRLAGADISSAIIRRRERAGRAHQSDIMRRLGVESSRTLQRSPHERSKIVEIADDGDAVDVEIDGDVWGEDVVEDVEAACVKGYAEGIEGLLDRDGVDCSLERKWR